jgi:hypothetical protein
VGIGILVAARNSVALTGYLSALALGGVVFSAIAATWFIGLVYYDEHQDYDEQWDHVEVYTGYTGCETYINESVRLARRTLTLEYNNNQVRFLS